MDLPRTNSCWQSWPTYRRRLDRLPGNSAASISSSERLVDSHDPTVGRSFGYHWRQNFRGFSGDAQWLVLFLLTLYMWIGIIPTECR
jgi:hypothetical protein